MARHIYELSDETVKVMARYQQEIADEADVKVQHINGILAGVSTDPFAPFEHYYAASVRAGAPICHYDQKLSAIRARYEKSAPNKSAFDCLADKITRNAEITTELVEALRDGQIDQREADRILNAVKADREVLDTIEVMMQFVVTDEVPVREQAKAAVAQYRRNGNRK